nr:immunoglobulin light chain junction region [Macaca mulatta]MOW27547.1 immunoglobulin light chain junction region [Macaca mulatta]MOW27682.1 immunoglobulin light chain junction region [Macaca mulatta]MOW28029.1 immunoglobulin light chain junction region [Macaca mulatta]MOW28044.1 immunoglobulin light chain junction region [Macaca mulatta]
DYYCYSTDMSGYGFF